MPTNDTSTLPTSADYVIVGAGMAGLYTAWRLLSHQPSATIVMVERLDRTGGRLQTDLIKLGDTYDNGEAVVREEEGGMRFTYSMRELMALTGALDLCDQIVPFPMTGANRRLEYRGRAFTQEDAAADPGIWAEIYDLHPAERGKSPVDLLALAYHRILSVNGLDGPPDDATPEFWQRFRLDFTWRGTALNHWQLWGLLRDMGYSEAAVVMMAHAIGFQGPFLSLMNAGEAFQLLEDFPSDPSYFTFARGFSTLPNTLARRIEAAGGKILLSTNVNAITADGDGFALDLTSAPEGTDASRHVPHGTPGRIHASQVVLALPRLALEQLFATSPALHDQPRAWELQENLKTTTDQQLLKINLYFDNPWWQNGLSGQPPITYGPSFTDLPLNAVYPFYAINGDAATSPAALTVYCDWDDANFWRGLQSVGPPFESPLQKEHQHPPYQLEAASQAVVDEVVRQFCRLFDTDWVPHPVLTSFRAWDGEQAHGYAVHQWALNADDRKVIADLVQPVPGIYTCNEAYSDMQGWVNGSLRSADRMLATFGIDPLVDTATPCEEPEGADGS